MTGLPGGAKTTDGGGSVVVTVPAGQKSSYVLRGDQGGLPARQRQGVVLTSEDGVTW